MQNIILDDQFLTSNTIDYEYKKYLLLAYQQRCMEVYKKRELYPTYTDIIGKLDYVNTFLKNINAFENSAQEIDRVDWLKEEILYKTKIKDDTFDDIKKTAVLANKILSDTYINFNNLYDDIDGSIIISGSKFHIFDLYNGYVHVKFNKNKSEKIFNYEIYKVLFPEPIFHLKTSKAQLKEYYSERYKKNIFEIIVNKNFPIKETTIPVVRRKFLLHVLGGYVL